MPWPERLLHRLPDAIAADEAALLEPLGVALHAADLAHVPPGGRAGVYGCGPLGLLLVQVLRIAGASSVVATDRLAHRVEMASDARCRAGVRRRRAIVSSRSPVGPSRPRSTSRSRWPGRTRRSTTRSPRSGPAGGSSSSASRLATGPRSQPAWPGARGCHCCSAGGWRRPNLPRRSSWPPAVGSRSPRWSPPAFPLARAPEAFATPRGADAVSRSSSSPPSPTGPDDR